MGAFLYKMMDGSLSYAKYIALINVLTLVRS